MSKNNNNMKIWDQVCQTDPKYTRKVNQRGGFTAIGAQSQVQKATEVFGAMGTGWGIEEERIDRWKEEGMVVYQATLWYLSNDKSKKYIPIHSAIRYNVNGRVDDDFFKKVATDALTKGLSKLGFNADVFLGLFDDNKYVNDLSTKYEKKNDPQKDQKLKLLVLNSLKGIPSDDDFYVKVIHALENGNINEGNLEGSIEKISDYKSKLQLVTE